MSIDLLSDDDYDRLARYVSGEAPAVERSETERWFGGDVARRAALEAMQLAWRTPADDPIWNVDAAWRSLSAGLSTSATLPKLATDVVDIGSKRRWWHDTARVMQVAAAAVVMVGGSLWLAKERTDGGIGMTNSTAPVIASTGSGERRSILLPDGSRATLGVSSTLRARPGYSSGAREVELEGEALFTVRHDAAHPFRVIVRETVVEDLGTEFAVRGYAATRSIRVAVASGSVAVRRGSTADTAVLLSPRDVATVGSSGEIAVTRGVDVSRFTAFAAGRLVFIDTPFAEVASELRRWYDVDVSVTDSSLLDRHLTSTFEGESLDEVLRIIGLSLNWRYVRDGNRVEFMDKAGVSVAPQLPTKSLAEAGA